MSTSCEPGPGVTKRTRLWNKDFILLWQGHFVSALGDVVYEIALGFWVLAVTGSTGLMGTLMAATVLPRVVLGPFAGVWVDRLNRKRIIVTADALRGILILAVAAAAFTGNLRIWMVFTAGVGIGIGGAFFNPSALSVIPDIVAKENLMKGNSAFSMIRAGTGIIGNGAGGFLFQVLGAPVMFLVNGVSYILSAFSEIFISIPRMDTHRENTGFFADFKSGMTLVWRSRGLRLLLLTAAMINFFASAAMVLILPMFQREAGLGAGRYGLVMSSLTVGMVTGMILLSAVKVGSHRRFALFAVTGIGMTLTCTLFPWVHSFPLMLLLLFAGGVCNAVVNVIIQTVLQITTPRNMRGKVFSIVETLAGSITPLAMAAGGILGEFLPLRGVISGCFSATLLVMIPIMFSSDFRTYICSDTPAGDVTGP